LIAGSGAFQGNGIPAALIAVTLKKMIDARLKMVVTIAMKFVSILNRLKKRRIIWLCKNRRDKQSRREKPGERDQSKYRNVMFADVEDRPL
jgi:hypothetical protein